MLTSLQRKKYTSKLLSLHIMLTTSRKFLEKVAVRKRAVQHRLSVHVSGLPIQSSAS